MSPDPLHIACYVPVVSSYTFAPPATFSVRIPSYFPNILLCLSYCINTLNPSAINAVIDISHICCHNSLIVTVDYKNKLHSKSIF